MNMEQCTDLPEGSGGRTSASSINAPLLEAFGRPGGKLDSYNFMPTSTSLYYV